jgi:hypothetical protein
MAFLKKKRAVSLTPIKISTLITAIVIAAKNDALLLKKETVKI